MAAEYNDEQQLTWSNSVDESSNGSSVIPVSGEIVDWNIRHSASHPAQQALLGRLFKLLLLVVVLLVPHRHGDGVVQDERPYEA